MKKRSIALFSLLFLLIGSIFASNSLLFESLSECTYSELVHISQSYGLDSSLSEAELRKALYEYFGLSEQKKEEVFYATTGTTIEIENCTSLENTENAVILFGDVRLGFEDRTLTAQKVVVDFSKKRLEASGSVILTDEKSDQCFEGQTVILLWEELDIVVFEGLSSWQKNNAEDIEVSLFGSGQSISYAGDNSNIHFTDGVFSTSEDDSLWSIEAQDIVFSKSDVFFEGATFKLGRVPILYVPFFFYPRSRMSFNPAMGLNSQKGAFLNTTFELYGKYNIQENKSEDSQIASLSSFLSTEEEEELYRDGLLYAPLGEDEEPSSLETWARSTSSYFVIFADAYEKTGLVLGLDTKNSLLDGKLKIDITAAVGYKAPVLRYLLDSNFSFKGKDLQVSASIPILSDPVVKQDYLNRNTSFSLDSVLGSEQKFNGSYTSQNSYKTKFNAKYSKDLGSFSFDINSLKAEIDYKLEKDGDLYVAKAKEASLPYVSLSSDGTFFDIKGKESKTVSELGYTNELAKQFEEMRVNLGEVEDLDEEDDETLLSYYSSPDMDLSKTVVTKGGSIKSGYTFNQVLDNVYKQDFVHDNFYTKINSSVYIKASAPGSWFSISETVYFTFNAAQSEEKENSDYKIQNSLEASIPKFGLTYKLNQSILSYKSTTDILSWGKWEKEDITEHSLDFSKNLGVFKLGLYLQFKPLVETIKPSLGLKVGGFGLSSSFSFENKDGSFKKGKGSVDLSYSDLIVSSSLKNSYDFSKPGIESDPWLGYSLSEKLDLKLPFGLKLSQSASLEKKFELKSLLFSASYSATLASASASITFKDKSLEKDSFDIKVSGKTPVLKAYKNRISVSSNASLSFKYDFQNAYRSSLSASFSFSFSLAKFMDLSFSFTSSNKSFYKYFDAGIFDMNLMLDDLLRSFDFFGKGRRNTGFNLSSFKVTLVHYMKDWNLYVDAEGKLTTQYSGKYEWVPQVSVYLKWVALPELKTEAKWNSKERKWQ